MKTYCKTIEKVDELPNLSYDGYIWMSDEAKPRKIKSKLEIPTGTQNPFIVEGFLKSEDEKISISLAAMNGELKIYQFNLQEINALPVEQKTENSFLTHRYDEAKIKFITVWLPEKDKLCEDMQVLQPKMRVFNGFELKN
jgi:CRISPR type III-associated protein (TIGR04423 family)